MPDRPARPCSEPGGCPNNREPNSMYCDDHKKRKNSRPIGVTPTPDYHDVRWARYRKSILDLNPICQWVGEDRRRCTNPASIIHHVCDSGTSPGNEHIFDYENCVAVCSHHHPLPSQKNQGQFVPTLYYIPMIGMELPVEKYPPGHMVPHDAVLWNIENRTKKFTEANRGQSNTA